MPQRVPYKNLIPLNEVIGQAFEKTATCKSVWDAYFRLIHDFGDEFSILNEIPVDDLARKAPERIAVLNQTTEPRRRLLIKGRACLSVSEFARTQQALSSEGSR